MATQAPQPTFIIDCPDCKAKVAARETGHAERFYSDDDSGQPYGKRVYVGNCPSCDLILAGESDQVDFEGLNAYEDRWSDIVRVYPKPPKTFASWRIPKVVSDSLNEADRSIQVGANIAACVMLGRALEGLCRDVLESKAKSEETTPTAPTKATKKLMLGNAIKMLRDKKVIDDRLYKWSQELQAFRNLAAHPEDVGISRDDAEDLQSFVNAIVEYVYDLADRYEEFKERSDAREKRKKF